ncbi:hypothetical protein Q8F55_009264 [Vanrija albida]|uniref:FAD dependent oxidoreductase domain-containing protein n=1 Tax=Vanrija albida TaxID=181172 RepID=A0ABR3PT53_9TREE
MPADIVIIGGGIIGVSTAYYLVTSPEQPRVTLIENTSIAAAASGKAAGFIAREAAWHYPATEDLARLSFAAFQDLAARFDGERAFGWRQFSAATGVLVGTDDGKMSEYRNLPNSRALDGSDRPAWTHGRRVDLSGKGEGGMGQVLPLEFTRRLHAEATLRGLRTVIGTPLARNAASRTIITDVGPVHYDKLIIAAGPWSAEVCRTLAIPPVPVSTLPGHSVLIRPLMPPVYDGILPAEAILAGVGQTAGDLGHGPGHSARVDHSRADATDPASGPYGLTKNIEFYPRPDNTIYGAGENAVPAPRGLREIDINRLPPTAADVPKLLDATLIARMLRASRAVSDSLDVEKGAELIKADFCYRPVCADKVPVIGQWAKDVYVSAGHGPWGITLAPGSGIVLAEMVLADIAGTRAHLSADIRGLDPHRFGGARL